MRYNEELDGRNILNPITKGRNQPIYISLFF